MQLLQAVTDTVAQVHVPVISTVTTRRTPASPAVSDSFILSNAENEIRSAFVSGLVDLQGNEIEQAVTTMISAQALVAIGRLVMIDEPLMVSGVSSQAALGLYSAVQQQIGGDLKLPRTLVFDYPTIADIAAYVIGKLRPSQRGQVSMIPTPPALSATDDTPVVLSGMACYLPVARGSVQECWQSLKQGNNSTSEIPATRFTPSNDAIYVRHGHFLQDAQMFENRFFAMSGAEVRATDPTHRLLLEVSFSACVDAGCTKKSLRNTDVGVFVGLCNVYDWMQLQAETISKVNVFGAHGVDASAASGRVSYLFGLKGPCISFNTACSSSLVALDAAVQNLGNVVCQSAIVGGVCLHLHQSDFAAMCALHALCSDGQCKTFDGRADGYGRSEVCGAVMLQASDKESIMVKATATNQDGRSSSFMAPNGPSQQQVIAASMQRAQQERACLVECHGTGTALGDPIEVGALTNVFPQTRDHPLLIGAIKSNVAHSEGAAGMAGLVKAALTMNNHQMAPGLHVQQLNPVIELDGFHLECSSQVEAFVSLVKGSTALHSVSGVSSFGFAGTNAHATLMHQKHLSHAVKQQAPCVCFRRSEFIWWGNQQVHTPSKVSSDAGIVAFEYYAPNLCCAAAEIEVLHNCKGRYTLGRGQEYIGFCADDEDTVKHFPCIIIVYYVKRRI